MLTENCFKDPPIGGEWGTIRGIPNSSVTEAYKDVGGEWAIHWAI